MPIPNVLEPDAEEVAVVNEALSRYAVSWAVGYPERDDYGLDGRGD